jgi:hypothetical protein
MAVLTGGKRDRGGPESISHCKIHTELFEDAQTGVNQGLRSSENSAPTEGKRKMSMRTGVQDKARKLAFGIGMGALLSIPVATMVSTTAGADTAGCYTGCSSPSTGLPVTSGDGSASATTTASVTHTAAPTGLAFTGADLSGMVIISVGALGAGTLLVRVSRRRRQTA